MNTLTLVGVSLLFACTLMTLCWWVARRVDNYSIVDAIWAFGFGLIALLNALIGLGYPPRKFLIAALFTFWGARLGLHLARRILGHIDQEDSRYLKLREEYGSHVARKFFIFFQYQALSIVILLVPVFIAVQNPEPELLPLEVIGSLIWLTGVLGESLADWQLSRFRKNPAKRGQVCDVGLWNYSRHPNYFFEFIIWCGYGTFALASPMGWIALYAPVLMYFLLTKVTGVPMAEAESIHSKGDRYRDYQKRVSVFFPLPPRH